MIDKIKIVAIYRAKFAVNSLIIIYCKSNNPHQIFQFHMTALGIQNTTTVLTREWFLGRYEWTRRGWICEYFDEQYNGH